MGLHTHAFAGAQCAWVLFFLGAVRGVCLGSWLMLAWLLELQQYSAQGAAVHLSCFVLLCGVGEPSCSWHCMPLLCDSSVLCRGLWSGTTR